MSPRYLALDAFRGATVALMILVNTPGSWQHIYSPFKHASWHGCTLTDLVFPCFLFIVGAALALSARNKASKVLPFHSQFIAISKRALIIFLIGLFLNAFPFNDALADLRVMGVLQRIAICYWFASLIVLMLPVRYKNTCVLGCILLILLAYWWLLNAGSGAEPYSLSDNVITPFDISIIGASHMWQGLGVPFEPEGLLSTIPAVASVLIGYQATVFLLNSKDINKAVQQFIIVGALLVVIGALWSYWLPINKSLWTSSYVLFSSGFALVILALSIYWLDIKGRADSVSYLIAMGANPLFLYVLSWLWVECYGLITMADNLSLYQQLFGWLNTVLSAKNASFIFAFLHVVLFTYLAVLLKKRKIFIKI